VRAFAAGRPDILMIGPLPVRKVTTVDAAADWFPLDIMREGYVVAVALAFGS
jgi:hypothetical protein